MPLISKMFFLCVYLNVMLYVVLKLLSKVHHQHSLKSLMLEILTTCFINSETCSPVFPILWCCEWRKPACLLTLFHFSPDCSCRWGTFLSFAKYRVHQWCMPSFIIIIIILFNKNAVSFSFCGRFLENSCVPGYSCSDDCRHVAWTAEWKGVFW